MSVKGSIGNGSGIMDALIAGASEESLVSIASSGDLAYRAVFEDDGRTAYAYLVRQADGVIVSDVWLYNRNESPSTPPWRVPGQRPPFCNPARYVVQKRVSYAERAEDVVFHWGQMDDGRRAVEIEVNGTKLGRLEEGAKPGSALLAACDGPLARVWR